MDVELAGLANIQPYRDAFFGCRKADFAVFAAHTITAVALACPRAWQTEPSLVGLFGALVVGVGTFLGGCTFICAESVVLA